MNRRLAWMLLAGSVVLVGAAVVHLATRPGSRPDDDSAVVAVTPEQSESVAADLRIHLYFAGAGDKLYPEARQIPKPADEHALARLVVEELLAGPGSERLTASFPPDVTLGSLYLTPDGLVFVDLRSEEHPTPPATGSTRERLALHSLVTSLVENVAEAESVVLLWNGRQPLTFGGHVDTSRPLEPAPDLLSS